MHCPIVEVTADGVACGRCWFFLPDGHTCPRHGDVCVEVEQWQRFCALTNENRLLQRRGGPTFPINRAAKAGRGE